MITGERQAARIRCRYLQAVLKQDIAFFDKEMTTGQLVERMSGDTILIQDAIGEKVDLWTLQIYQYEFVMLVLLSFLKLQSHRRHTCS